MRRINNRPFLGARGRLLEAGAVIYGRGDDNRANPRAAGGTAEPGSDPAPGPNANLSCRQGYKDLVCSEMNPKKKEKNSLKAKIRHVRGSRSGSSSRVPQGCFR